MSDVCGLYFHLVSTHFHVASPMRRKRRERRRKKVNEKKKIKMEEDGRGST